MNIQSTATSVFQYLYLHWVPLKAAAQWRRCCTGKGTWSHSNL